MLPPNDPMFADFGVQMVATRQLTSRRLDSYFGQCGISLDGYNLINIDVQGYELPVLLGLGRLLNRFDAVIAEVNWAATYAGVTRPQELESFLVDQGFRRVWLGISYPQATGIWVRGSASAMRRYFMALTAWSYFVAARIGLVKLLRSSGILAWGRRVYCSVKGRPA